MSKRKYGACVRCGRSIDITNQDIDLCVPCSKQKMPKIPTTVSIEPEHLDWIEKNHVSLTKFVRAKLDEEINKS